MSDLKIHLHGAGDDELAELGQMLRADLLTQGAEAVERAPRAERDEQDVQAAATKGAPIDWSTLLVSLSSSSVLIALVDALLSWVNRNQGVSVTLSMDGDELTLTGAGPYTEEQQRAIDLWLNRHKGFSLPDEG